MAQFYGAHSPTVSLLPMSRQQAAAKRHTGAATKAWLFCSNSKIQAILSLSVSRTAPKAASGIYDVMPFALTGCHWPLYWPRSAGCPWLDGWHRAEKQNLGRPERDWMNILITSVTKRVARKKTSILYDKKSEKDYLTIWRVFFVVCFFFQTNGRGKSRKGL